jgi:hypothetical protein
MKRIIMLRQLFLYLFLSILVVVFARYAHLGILYIATLFAFIQIKLEPLFNQTGWGFTVRNVIILVSLPVFFAAVPALSYRLIKGKGREMPHFIPLIWIFWIILLFSILLIR